MGKSSLQLGYESIMPNGNLFDRCIIPVQKKSCMKKSWHENFLHGNMISMYENLISMHGNGNDISMHENGNDISMHENEYFGPKHFIDENSVHEIVYSMNISWVKKSIPGNFYGKNFHFLPCPFQGWKFYISMLENFVPLFNHARNVSFEYMPQPKAMCESLEVLFLVINTFSVGWEGRG